MKILFVFIASIFLSYNLSCQVYCPFPTDNAQWNSLTLAQWSPNDILYVNSQYRIHGDTIIKNTLYHKTYYYHSDNPIPYSEYIGGMREDLEKNVFFHPSMIHLPNYCASQFPSDTTEYLLYTFDSLRPGMTLPINTEVTEIVVVETDSILLNNTFRKRYKISQQGIFDYDYWIEGIGSTSDLFAPFSYEFEWRLFTLCFTDTLTHYLNAPNGEDSCHYMTTVGMKEIEPDPITMFLTPPSELLVVNAGVEKGIVKIYNFQGQSMLGNILVDGQKTIDIKHMKPGIYIAEFANTERRQYVKFFKE